jgi:hypothetical protein
VVEQQAENGDVIFVYTRESKLCLLELALWKAKVDVEIRTKRKMSSSKNKARGMLPVYDKTTHSLVANDINKNVLSFLVYWE